LFLKWGENGDFNGGFYKTAGNALVETMMFNAYYPIIEFLMYLGIRIAYRIKDKCCCMSDKDKAKKLEYRTK